MQFHFVMELLPYMVHVMRLGEGDEVITSPITFAASANCVRYVGGTVVFADIDATTYNIDPTEIRKNITAKTKAIIPVDFRTTC